MAWITAFLIGRSQKVSINGYESVERPVLSGIPQGSVLAPMLFVLYLINDLPESVISHTFLFADDTIMYNIISKPSDCELLQGDLKNLAQWSGKWLVRFHAGKCKHMHLGNKKNICVNMG